MNSERRSLLPQNELPQDVKLTSSIQKQMIFLCFLAASFGTIIGSVATTRWASPLTQYNIEAADMPVLGHSHDNASTRTMKRTAIDPTSWSAAYSFHQAEVVEGATKTLRVSGQYGKNERGELVSTEMKDQLVRVLSNIDDILESANMSRTNIVRIRSYTTDTEDFFANYDVLQEWLKEADVMPPHTLLGVSLLYSPEYKVEIEVEAAS